ncbi:MAG: cysteine rich repeat-containing protein [bacterium]|nr:cysteine rich repeat-containing protein [bacterium]
MLRALLTVAVLCALVASTRPAGAVVEPCRDDARKLCPDIEPGGGRVLACLRPKLDKLSPGCARVIKGSLAAVRAACEKDTQRLCAGLAPGGGRIATCLREHAAELDPTCRRMLDMRKDGTPRAANKKDAAAN